MAVVYDIKAKPTLYKGVQMRSRLEAKWAAFFDLCGWEWVYEPMDLGQWSPDFLLRSAFWSGGVLVEVKPIQAFDSAVWDKMWTSVSPAHGLLLLGTGPIVTGRKYWEAMFERGYVHADGLAHGGECDEVLLGWCRDAVFLSDDRPTLATLATVRDWMPDDSEPHPSVVGRLDFYGPGSLMGVFPFHLCGLNQKGGWVHGDVSPVDAWAKACNTVQWRPR